MGLIDRIDVYHAEKQDGVTTQHITIYYNCISAFSVLDRRKIPAAEIAIGPREKKLVGMIVVLKTGNTSRFVRRLKLFF